MTCVLGIDPGSRCTGYGLIEVQGSRQYYVASGVVRVSAETLPDRLKQVYQGICAVVEQYHPQHVAIEEVFMAKNPSSALKLGQARGVAIVAVSGFNLPLAEYSAKRIKQAVVGRGGADKQQVQHMVKAILKLQGKLQADAADALAVAICHANQCALGFK